MAIEVVRNDITLMKADGVVNSADRLPVILSVLDQNLNKKAGAELIKAREEIGSIEIGQSALTKGYNLPAAYVIHTVPPKARDKDAEQLLRSCYQTALAIAQKMKMKSVAFPLLGAGNNLFPVERAFKIAVDEIGDFLMNQDMQVFLVVFEQKALLISEKLFSSVNHYIDDLYVDQYLTKGFRTRRNVSVQDVEVLYERIQCNESAQISDDLIEQEIEKTFSEVLIDEIERKGLKASEIYKKANVDRRHFSKIRNNLDYQPTKMTAIAFAIALEMNYEETIDFIGKAGYVLTHSRKFDIIIEYCIRNKIYNIFEVNEILYAFDQPLLL